MEIIWLGNILGYGTSFFGNIYGVGGVAPCLQSRDYKGPRMVLVKNHKQRESNRNDKEIINYGYIGVGGQKGFVYGVDGICNTLPATQYKDATKILIKVKNETDSIRIYEQRNRETSE